MLYQQFLSLRGRHSISRGGHVFVVEKLFISTRIGEETFFVSFKPPRPGTEPWTLAWKAAVLTTTLGPPPCTYSTRFTNLHKVRKRSSGFGSRSRQFERSKNVSFPSTCESQYCGEPPGRRRSVLGLRPPGLEFRILCLEDSVISIISSSSGGSPGPV